MHTVGLKVQFSVIYYDIDFICIIQTAVFVKQLWYVYKDHSNPELNYLVLPYMNMNTGICQYSGNSTVKFKQ